jgi:membrane associated rhomboid family serine protease
VRPVWLIAGVGYLLSVASWSGLLPDFTTVGHLFATAIGLLLAVTLTGRRAAFRAGGS